MGKKGFIISLSTVVGLIIGIILVFALYDIAQAVVGLIPTKARINKDNLDSFQSLLEDLKQLGEEGEKQGVIYPFTESTSLITLNKGDITFPEIRERYYACKQVSCICVCQQGDCKSRVICEPALKTTLCQSPCCGVVEARPSASFTEVKIIGAAAVPTALSVP